MAESITISTSPPPLKSMDYSLLRAEGLRHIQELAGKIWTDDNAHDPGITILEMLAYAITDLGYRTNYNIRDILTTELPEDIKNFFPAKEIMPNYPVTLNDYRKLLIDVELVLADVANCESVGIKNAWIEKSSSNEIPFFLDAANNTLSYTQPAPSVDRTHPAVLYDILLEFGSCQALGDLNANTLVKKITLNALNQTLYPNTNDVSGTIVEFEVEFPRWDTPGINWEDPADIKKNIKSFDLKFSRLPSIYKLDSYGVLNAGPNKGDLWITMLKNFAVNSVGNGIAEVINDTVLSTLPLGGFSGMVLDYQLKVKAIFQILEKAKATLMEHRNLGEDFFNYNAIKVDQIALCSEVEIANNADVEEVYAQIVYQIKQFLDPTIFFYSLSEMYGKGYTTDQIFEGPLLDHGFIEDKELTKADRRKTIHVSDLISIIMDIPGVIAVRKIEIAGIPLDNDDNIPVESVRWCLEIPIEKNYVPRLSVTDSKLLFFKDNLPYRANANEAQTLLDQLEANDRPQKINNPSQDIALEAGEYKDIENYFSIQEEFPLVYGTQSAGLPSTATIERYAQAKQLKGYLLFYEQLLADFLSQLFHVKDLFSFNENLNTNGNPVIDKTYFSQSLINLVPDALPLYVNPVGHAARLQKMVESEATFLQRRNRVLDHLMARFAESFNDYAMVVYKIDGAKAPAELIQDKLQFLNNYPLISSARDTGFNYLDPDQLWHIDNVSGLERRVSYINGINRLPASSLAFSGNFQIIPAVAPDEYYIEIQTSLSTPILRSPGAILNGFPSIDAARLSLETIVINGVQVDKFIILDSNDLPIPDPTLPPPSAVAPFHYVLVANEITLAESVSTFASATLAKTEITTSAQPTISAEFYNNPESNRYNLECFMDKYIVTPLNPTITILPLPCPPKYTWPYTLTNGGTPATDFLFGELSGAWEDSLPGDPTAQAFEYKESMFMEMLRTATNISNYRFGVNGLMQEIFTVVDRCGDVIATSSEEDFNFTIQQQLIQIMGETAPYNEIRVVDSTGNNAVYTMSANVVMDTVNTQLLKIQVVEPIVSGIVDGSIRYDINSLMPSTYWPTILEANTAENFFKVDKELHRIILPNEKVTVETGANAGDYTVVKVVQDGTDSFVYVKEDIPSTIASSILAYSKVMPIYKLSQIADPTTNSFYVKPGVDEAAAQEIANWIKAKFFSHEGMHVVEHILLRPKYNQSGPSLSISPTNNNELLNTAPFGKATFLKQFALSGISQINKRFVFAGNYAPEFQPLQKIRIVSSTFNDNTYTVRYATNVGPNTEVTIYEAIPDWTPTGSLQYSKTFVVNSIPGPDQIIITDPLFVAPANNEVYITSSFEEENDGKFHVSATTSLPANQYQLTFDTKVAMIVDDFLPIDLDNGCNICRYEDPYSFIVTVILPSWQGRFYDQTFRKFFDKSLRMECPAHIVLNICWIDCKQMGEFELHYKEWLQAQDAMQVNKLEVSNSLNKVINDITHLRSVYPDGILHDCESDPEGENAIILNQTILGIL